MPRNSPVPPLALFRTMHRNPKLAAAMHPFGRFNLRDSSIAPRDREIVIHRTCALCHCEYEWGVHVASFAERVGFSAAEIEATVTGAAVWDDREQLLVSLTDALHRTAAVPDVLWAGLREHWSENQLLELVALVGCTTLSLSWRMPCGSAWRPGRPVFPAGNYRITLAISTVE